jgi:hypothetical protein
MVFRERGDGAERGLLLGAQHLALLAFGCAAGIGADAHR